MNAKSVQEVLPHVRQALSSLLQCWDALNAAERILGFEISVDDLSVLAADLFRPEDSQLVTTDQIADWLAETFT